MRRSIGALLVSTALLAGCVSPPTPTPLPETSSAGRVEPPAPPATAVVTVRYVGRGQPNAEDVTPAELLAVGAQARTAALSQPAAPPARQPGAPTPPPPAPAAPAATTPAPTAAEPAQTALPSASYTLKLSGTPGLHFEGSFRTLKPDGSPASQGVAGTLPATFEARGSSLSASFQKGGKGELTIEVLKDGQSVAHATAGAANPVARATAD